MIEKLESLKKELEEVKQDKFYNSMCDYWTQDDHLFNEKCCQRINELESEIDALESALCN